MNYSGCYVNRLDCRKICKNCGKEFKASSVDKKVFCSPNCVFQWHKEKKYQNEIRKCKTKDTKHLRLRFEIFKRDNFTCVYCGRNPKEDGIKIVIDHIFPRAKGLNNHPSNLCCSCIDCNGGKIDILLNDFSYLKS